MYSKRQYPPRVCLNPACQIKFIPHDRRQLYCCTQRRINANNDRRYLDNNSRFLDERQARINNKILDVVWKKLNNKKRKLVSREILEWSGFKFESPLVIKKNSGTNQNILWVYDYGLELADQSGNLFEIHKKTVYA